MILPPGFDRQIALEAAALVNQAYDQYTNFTQHKSWSLKGNYDCLGELRAKPDVLFAKVEPFGFVARNKTTGNLFVTFRGTESADDWLIDFTFPQRNHEWGKVEDGFAKLYDQCYKDVRSFVEKGQAAASGPSSTVIVTGHSLGGSLATLATADLVVSGTAPQATIYSFASPRVGDPSFARRFNENVEQRWRIANTEDIVPIYPLATLELFRPRHFSLFTLAIRLAGRFEYEHVGNLLAFTTHEGTIPANHAMQVYINAVQAATAATAGAAASK